MSGDEMMMSAFSQMLARDREWGDARPSPNADVWTRDQLAEAYLLAGMDRRSLLNTHYRLADEIARALQTDRHKLVRAAPDGVACICGQYDDSAHGIEAAELWRGHLIEAALKCLPRPEIER